MKKLLYLILLLTSLVYVTQKAYAVSDIEFEDLFANHQSIMLIIHPISGEIYYANQAAADFYGYPLEILLEMNINDINTLTSDEVAAERLKALEEERNFFIFKHRLSNDDIRTVYVYSYPVDINGETYLYSIIIDQIAFIIAQNRNRILILSGVSLLILSTILTSYLAIKISKKKQEITRANETLYESEQRFKILHDASFGGLAIHDQGKILDCNQGLSDITGYSMSELLNSNGLDLIAPDYRDIVMDKIKSGYEKPYEVQGIRKNGEIYPLKLEARNLPYHGKQVRVVEFRDITEIKKQQELKKSFEDQWSKLVQEMPLGFNIRELVYDENENPIDYVFISVNDNYEVITGLKREDIIGKYATEVLPDIEKSWFDNYSLVVKEKKTFVIEDYSRALGKYFRVVAYPYRDKQFIIVAEDITERINHEQQLTRNEAEKSRIISNLPGVSYKCKFDESWTMLFMSDVCETLTGYTPSELIENKVISYKEVIVPKYRDYVFNRFSEARNQQKPCHLEYEIQRKDGSHIWIWEKGITYFQDSEWYIEGFLMDITERKISEEKITYISNHDYLTNLYNRRYFVNTFNSFISKGYSSIALMMIDINGLKLINDAYGHVKGDLAIKSVSNLLMFVFDQEDVVARLGGDEFAILLINKSDEEIQIYKEKLIELSNEIRVDNVQISLAIGYEILREDDNDINDLLNRAEKHLYRHKVTVGESVRNHSIKAILNTLTDKYKEEKAHSAKVSLYCMEIGIEIGLSKEDNDILELAGMYHDIGKISIPDAILDKPGKLTDEEFDIIKTHTQIGYQILRAADEYSGLAEYALSHHERWDGLGYPKGLKGEDIPLFSRVICVADAFEAMTSNRTYRKAMKIEDAIKELNRCSGTQFDPNLVKIFVEIIQKSEALKKIK